MYEHLIELFEEWAGESLVKYAPLPRSGSDRQYFRLHSASRQAIGVINSDKKENTAFISFTEHFRKHGLPVPEILGKQLDEDIYLLEDLGDMTLFNLIQIESERARFSPVLTDIYKRILEYLPLFQIRAGKDLDYSVCYPRASFDHQSMMWDLNYFKYYFLKLAAISFDEQALEDDFQTLTDYLMGAPSDFFLYRDFQSRNIMIRGEEIWFIDYQGGRKGALQYDLASILYDAKANIPEPVREELLAHYIGVLQQFVHVNSVEFRSYFYAFVLIRIMQAMGAYGFRGFYEKKAHFLASIPYAMGNLSLVLEKLSIPVDLPTLLPVLKKLSLSEKLKGIGRQTLQLSINSFSYKRGIPVDESGHGGGFVFDCRALPNPGRLERFRNLTGKDQEVIDYLKTEPEVNEFLKHCQYLSRQSVKNYLERNFRHLSISFGCTGGQHRSVYLAEQLAAYLRNEFDIKIVVRHREQEMKQKEQ